MRISWTPEKHQWLAEHYPRMRAGKCTALFNKTFGCSATKIAVINQAARIGIATDTPPGWYKVSEVAEMFGVHRNNILSRIKNGSITAKRFGRRVLISEEEFTKLGRWYTAKAPWPAISVPAASDLLGYSDPNNLSSAAIRGSIDSVRIGRNFHLNKAQVLAGLEYLKCTGETRVPWARLKKQAQEKQAAS